MRAVLQRVLEANVKVNGETVGSIDKGIMVLVGFKATDDRKTIEYMIEKINNLRIFEDENEKMNLSLHDIEGQILIVPNFTLYGDCRKGRRPSYATGAPIQRARELFDEFIKVAKTKDIYVETGIFQADMKVSIINDGPVTLLIDSDKEF